MEWHGQTEPFQFEYSPSSSQVWVKPPGELPFLYGNHVVKAHLGRITEDTPEHQGVVVYTMSDIPLVRTVPDNVTEAIR